MHVREDLINAGGLCDQSLFHEARNVSYIICMVLACLVILQQPSNDPEGIAACYFGQATMHSAISTQEYDMESSP
jgi:hypothetical protein